MRGGWVGSDVWGKVQKKTVLLHLPLIDLTAMCWFWLCLQHLHFGLDFQNLRKAASLPASYPMLHQIWTAPNLTLFQEHKSAASPRQSLMDDNLNLIYQALAFIPPAIFRALVFLEGRKRWKKLVKITFVNHWICQLLWKTAKKGKNSVKFLSLNNDFFAIVWKGYLT